MTMTTGFRNLLSGSFVNSSLETLTFSMMDFLFFQLAGKLHSVVNKLVYDITHVVLSLAYQNMADRGLATQRPTITHSI